MQSFLEDFRAAFRLDELSIYANASWTWSLRLQQPTLGCGVISLNTEAARLSDMPPSAGSDYRDVVRVVERTLMRLFEYDKINYLTLMMVDRQVHCHVIPRYSKERLALGRAWTDTGWPKFPNLADDNIRSDPQLLETLLNHIKKGLAPAD